MTAPEPNHPAADDAGSLPEMEPVMVTMTFETARPDELIAVLATYVVMSRNDPESLNIDLVASTTRPGRLTVIEKWSGMEAQRVHFDSDVMVQMATACTGLLTAPPDIDLHEPVTMHDWS